MTGDQISFSDGLVITVLIGALGTFLILAGIIAMTPTPQFITPCTSWGTTSGKEFDPPSTEWYNEHCNTTALNETCKMSGDMCGHYREACGCYEYKHIELWHWENAQTVTI